MDKILKHSVFIFVVSVLVSVSLACSASVKAKNEVDSNEIGVQEVIFESVTEAESQEIIYKPILLSEEEFAKLVVDFTSSNKKFKGEKPCIIDFYADWCRPCRMFAPTFEKVAGKYGDKVNFYKVNTDNCGKLARAYNITSIPTLFFFDKNGTLSRASGVPSEEEFENAVKFIMQ